MNCKQSITKEETISFQNKFEEEVFEGLTSFPKHISSKYFYDEKGDQLFQDIMNLPEYYLTNSEFEVISNNKKALAEIFNGKEGFDLIELGAGDGRKTKVLLKYLSENKYDFNFLPIDISQNALDQLQASLDLELPKVNVKPQQGTYFGVLEQLSSYSERKKVILLLGSNIGNLLHPQAILFLKNLQQSMGEDDLLFMGFDQKKNPQTVLDAYNDQTGVTADFNKNILTRINRELDADFDLDNFLHWEVYDPETGTAKSFLVSKKEHAVTIGNLNQEICFKEWETIHTEISQKYDDSIVEWLADESGLKIDNQFTDSKNYFKNYLFSKA